MTSTSPHGTADGFMRGCLHVPIKDDLRLLQSLPLEIKIAKTKQRIREWVTHFGKDGVYVSFSGGKDSTVLLHLVRELYPDIEAVFVNTGLEYPEIQKFVKTFDNVTILRPKMRFDDVIRKYGYPIISKRISDVLHGASLGQKSRLNLLNGLNYDGTSTKTKFSCEKYKPLLDVDFRISNYCCDIMKKKPMKKYQKETRKYPIIATMAVESMNRETVWMSEGCNAYETKNPNSKPMSFWTEQDVLQYIKENNIPIASVYGDIVYKEDSDQMRIEDFGISGCGADKLCTTGCSRTGCIFCAFGAHLEKAGEGRFERLKETHPRQYEYCIGGGEYVDGVWKPNKDGLGMGHVFDELNRIYGDGFIRY